MDFIFWSLYLGFIVWFLVGVHRRHKAENAERAMIREHATKDGLALYKTSREANIFIREAIKAGRSAEAKGKSLEDGSQLWTCRSWSA